MGAGRVIARQRARQAVVGDPGLAGAGRDHLLQHGRIEPHVLAHRQGDWGRVLDLLWPIRNELWRLGGSHAQRDIFRQMLADAAARAGDRNRLRAVLAEEAAGRTLPLTRRRGYAPLAIAA